MFEIGSNLREARLRRHLELSHVERDTHIRARYLMALEDDRFEALPGTAYAKGFLRTYADYLGLDGSQFVDEFNSRFAPEDEPAAAPVRVRSRGPSLSPWMVVAPVAAVLVGLVSWQLSSSGGGGGHRAPLRPPVSTHVTRPARPTAPPAVRRGPVTARIALAASRGPCWLSVHVGSPTGRLVFERTLEPGETAHFVSQRLWMRFGAPWNLDATLNGKSLRLPASTGDAIVTATGLTAVR